MTVLAACRVRVPCTTSNLGAGFDCLGLALNRYLDASFEPGGDGLRLERSGTLAELDGLDVQVARDRLAAAFTSRLRQAHGTPNGVLRVASDIPIAKGLGSSAAATIAGLVLARAAAGAAPTVDRGESRADREVPVDSSPTYGPRDLPRREGLAGVEPALEDAATDGEALGAQRGGPRLARPAARFALDEVAGEAVAIEGHPDNVGAALLGGLVFAGVVASSSPDDTSAGAPTPRPVNRPMLRRLPLSPEIGFAFAAPPAPVDTADARAMLPPTVPFGLAARSVARLGALLHGLAHADPECLRAGFDDELHVPHRLPRIPGGAGALAAAREAGAWAATVSGSGSGLIAVCPAGAEAAVAEAMCEALRRAAGHAVGFALRPDVHGTRLVEP